MAENPPLKTEKKENHDLAIPIYTSGITTLVTMSTAGIAAATALMQISGTGAANQGYYLTGLVIMSIGVVACFFAMSGLTGQATLKTSNINVGNIRLPVLVAFLLVCVGFIILGYGASHAPSKQQSESDKDILKNLTGCRYENTSPDLRVKCYDAYVDASLIKQGFSENDFKGLSEKNQLWIKMLIKNLEQEKK